MEARKNPENDLTRFMFLFFNIGMVISLLLVITAFNWKFYDITGLMDMGISQNEFDQILDIPITTQPPPLPPKLKNINIIEVVNVGAIEDQIDIDLDIDITEETTIKNATIKVNLDDIEEESTDEIFTIVEQQPKLKGGLAIFIRLSMII